MMKRRNVDCVKPRRPLKRNKLSEGIYGSSVIYIKFVLVWLLVLAADYLLDFRFEYLWPFWLLLRSVYDSFRYQGLAFCVLFLCMAVTADMVAIVFIPASWLFFAASTYVWVQFVWHTEKGVCMPTVILWAIFIYIEALVRLKEVKNVPFHMDLCRPFAAHCIGYPVVTLGFGLKSYVGYRLRQRKQREVARENEFYAQLLQEALPPDLQHIKNMNNAAAQASAAAVKEYEDSELGDADVSISNPSTSGGRCRIGWSRDSCLPSLAFLTRLRKLATSSSTPATATPSAASASHAPPKTSWWWSWRSKPDNSYNNGSSHTLNSCLAQNSVSSSSSTSSSSSCSSSSSSSSNSSSSSVCSNRGGGRSDGVGGGGGGGAANGTITGVLLSSPPPPPPTSTAAKQHHHNNKLPTALHAELEYMQKKSVPARSVNNFDENAADRDKTAKGSDNSSTSLTAPTEEKQKNKSNAAQQVQQSNGSAKVSVTNNLNVRNDTSSGGGNSKKNKNKESNRDTTTPAKDDAITVIKLETELKRARSELNRSNGVEQDLRNQINSLVSSQKNCQQEMTQLQQDNDTLQNKLHGLVTARQSDRAAMGGQERRLAEERRQRQAAEAQLQQVERRARKLEEQQQQYNNRQHQAKSNNSGECSEACRTRRAELDAEVKRVRRDYRAQEDKTRAVERENVSLRQYKESQNDSEVLMSALSAMQERNAHLETTLSAETRVKLDLFSALGEAKRHLQIAQGHIESKDKEINELKSKFTEVLAVGPATSFSSSSLHTNSPYQYSSKLLMTQVSNSLDQSSPMQPGMVSDLNLDSLVVGLGFASGPPPPAISPQLPISPNTPGPISPPCSMSPPHPQLSNLDPNARIYTPKCVNGTQSSPQDN